MPAPATSPDVRIVHGLRGADRDQQLRVGVIGDAVAPLQLVRQGAPQHGVHEEHVGHTVGLELAREIARAGHLCRHLSDSSMVVIAGPASTCPLDSGRHRGDRGPEHVGGRGDHLVLLVHDDLG